MITPEYLEQCPDRLVEIYEQAERDIIADMARKISKYDYFSSAAEWQAMKLQEMGLTYKEIQKRLAKASGKSKAEIVKLLKEAGVKELKDDGVKPTQSTVNTLNAGLSKTLGTFDNLTRTTATQGTRQISQALDRAYAQVSSGAFSQETAVKNAISDLAKNGIEAYDYGTRKDYIDVVVRRAVRTGVNQTVAKIALSNADELGTDLVEVSAHSGARPSHAEWQGKVYSISGETEGYEKLSEATGYGSVTGLCGANCRHTFYPFFEGDEPTYSEEELKSFDKPKYTYNGEKMTEYEATQRQRYIERQIRRWKREKVGMEAAGLSSERANAKLKKWGEIQADFLGQTGLKRQYGREEIPKVLKNNSQNGIINIELDGFTPCLVDSKTGEVLDTVVGKIKDRQSLKKYNENNGWFINWNEVPADCTVCFLKTKGSDEIQGLAAFKVEQENYAVRGHWIVSAPHNRGESKKYIGVGGHLFAIMINASVEAGYDGFFYGMAANKRLLQHYIDNVKAEPIGGLRFCINEASAHEILEKYNFKKE